MSSWKSYNIQFGFFLDPPDDDSKTNDYKLLELNLLESVKSKRKGGQLALTMFKPAGIGKIFIQTDSQTTAYDQITLTSTSGIWIVEYSPARIDIKFNVVDYENLLTSFGQTSDFSLSNCRERIIEPIIQFLEKTSKKVTRLTYIITVEQTHNEESGPAIQIADKFFNDKIKEKISKEEIYDLSARVNFRGKVQLEGIEEEKVTLNRIETGEASWYYENNKPSIKLIWQYDFNTSPIHSNKVSFVGTSISDFFFKAEDWCNKRISLSERED